MLPGSFPRQGRLGQRRSTRPEEVGSAIFEHQIPSTHMWSYSRLTNLSIESNNTWNGLQTRKLWSSEVGASHEQQLTCRTDRCLLSFISFEHNMSSDYIDPYIYGCYTQRDFHRVYQRMKQTSYDKVMIVRSWHTRAHSLLSLARRAQPRRSTRPHTALPC